MNEETAKPLEVLRAETDAAKEEIFASSMQIYEAGFPPGHTDRYRPHVELTDKSPEVVAYKNYIQAELEYHQLANGAATKGNKVGDQAEAERQLMYFGNINNALNGTGHGYDQLNRHVTQLYKEAWDEYESTNIPKGNLTEKDVTAVDELMFKLARYDIADSLREYATKFKPQY